MTATVPCPCLDSDATAAARALRGGRALAELADESHFMAAIRQCPACGQHHLTLFCECVDWADGDDPNVSLAVPISADEVERLLQAGTSDPEAAILAIVGGERRYRRHDRPKGAPATHEWVTGVLHIPAHD